MGQKGMVFDAITTIYTNQGKTLADGEPVTLNANDRKAVTDMLVEQFQSSPHLISEGKRDKIMATEASLRKYCTGLISNWLRKDTRLNGGTQYKAKNPGARVGSNDEQLLNMRNLLKNNKDNPEACAAIQAAIDERQAALKAERASKTKPVEIDVSALPPHLQDLVETV